MSLSTVTRAVARLRRESAMEPRDAFMDLVWHPGEAQADFGEVDVLYRGATQRMRHFVLDFPYSNIGLAQLMPGENAECTCQALQNLFEWLKGMPERIVFDNAAGVGAGPAATGSAGPACSRRSRRITGSTAPPVPPVRGSREGRRGGEGWHGPPQAVRAQTECVESGELQLPTARQMPGARQETHHAKDEEETRLFSEDRGALLPLPAKRFDVVTWRRMRTDKYGVGHDRRQAPLLHRRVPRAP